MKEKPIIRSPYAFDPYKAMLMTEKEREELYSRRVDQLVQPYTVIDVLTKVYHRDFRDDLLKDLKRNSYEFGIIKEPQIDWSISQFCIKDFKVVRVESVFGQPVNNFQVDICCETELKVVETHDLNYKLNRCSNVKALLRLRYQFNFTPCELCCEYIGIVYSGLESLYTLYPDALHMDKYLLPVLRDRSDYERMARDIIDEDMPEYLDTDKMIFGIEWIKRMGLGVYYGEFPENGVMGEYFLGFGKAKVLDPDTVTFIEQKINPGTILLNKDLFGKRGQLNSTSTHEGIHHRLGYFYFMLQMCHGGCYSYLCKRNDVKQDRITTWTPVDIMELHANKLPAYILIQEKPGKAKAKELLESYGGERSIENLRRLIVDMAEHFGVTLTIAKSRLYEFGYTEISGIGVYLNGAYIPPYLSDLGKNQTYTIDESEAILEYVTNPKFRKVIDTGRYMYVEGHYCLMDGKYIACDHLGDRHLTVYAREHMSECCLAFDIKYESIMAAVAGGVLRKTAAARKVVRYIGRNGESLITAEGLALRQRIQQEMEERSLMEKSFNQMTVDLMASKGFTIPKLAERTGLSVETIKNMRNDPDKRIGIEAVVAVCIAMGLSYDTSMRYIDKSPSKLTETEQMYYYRYALKEWSGHSIAEVNRKLIQSNAEPLTELIQGYEDDIFRATS